MQMTKTTLNAEIGFISIKVPSDEFLVMEKFELIEPLKLPPPILPYDQIYSRSLNISTGNYQKHPINSSHNQDQNSVENNDDSQCLEISPIPINKFDNHNIRSPRLVKRKNFSQIYEDLLPEVDDDLGQNNIISPICAKCLGINKKFSCVIS